MAAGQKSSLGMIHQAPVDLPLTVEYRRGRAEDWLRRDDSSLLGVIEFGRATADPGDPRHVSIALEPLGDSPGLEIWRAAGPVLTGRWQDIHYSQSRSLTLAQIPLTEATYGGIRDATRHAYQQIQSFMRRHPHHCLLKIWHYIPAINQGDGDQERYRQFCIGRAEALDVDPAARPAMPAATAIGSPADCQLLQIYFLCGESPGIHVENSRQVSAPDYPRQYGPQSPLFSRGTLMQQNGHRQFLISGTASVIGHETHHKQDVLAQARESLANVSALLEESRRLTGSENGSMRGPLKFYVRHRQDLPQVLAASEESHPDNPLKIYLQGDICRTDLLTELEGIATL